ncbi:MAG: nucleoside recognition domain-containing protein [Bythopirellula sp.]
MLNKIWFGLLLIGIVYGFARGCYNSIWPPQKLPEAEAVELSLQKGNELRAKGKEFVAAIANEQPEPLSDKALKLLGEDFFESMTAAAAPPPLADRNLLQMGKDLNAAALDAAELSIEICIGLIGIMALWLGLLAVARDAGLVDALARLLSPLMRWLFPEIPDGHPAQGAMLMNISANMLNLDNAATPLGLKAMKELQTLNPTKDTATNSMAMFMAINTSNVTLIPFTIIGYRALKGSENPAEPTLGIIIVTTISTIVAIIVARYLAKSSRYAWDGNSAVDATEDEP